MELTKLFFLIANGQDVDMEVHRKLFATCGAMTFLFAVGGCGTVPTAYRGFASIEPIALPTRISPEQADEITIYAVGLVGTPYRYGGNTPDSRFDCSGLISHVYKTRAAIAPPRTVSTLQNWGQPISADNLRSGDVILFGKGDVVSHAGIYVGDGRFVHAPSTGGEVRLDRLNSKYWSTQQVSFRRP